MKSFIARNKVQICLFFLNAFLTLIAYSVFICNMHYAADTYDSALHVDDIARAYFQSGRPFAALIYVAFDGLSFNPIDWQFGTQMVLALSIAICSTYLTMRFSRLYQNSKLKILLVDAVVLFLFINPSMATYAFYFVEVSLTMALSLVVLALSIGMWCSKGALYKRALISLILLIVALGMYQVYVEIYIGFCVAFSMAKYDFRFSRESCIECLIVFAIGACGSIENIAFMSYAAKSGIAELSPRAASMTAGVLISNVKALVKLQPAIWLSMDGLSPVGCPIILAFALIVGIAVGVVKTRKLGAKDIAYGAFVLFAIYSAVFAPLVFSGSYSPAHRTYLGFYTIFLYMGAAFLCVCTRQMLKGAICGAAIVLTVSTMIVVSIQANTLVSNRLDEYAIQCIGDQIKDYEEATGESVDLIEYAYDDSRAYSYAQVGYTRYDANLRHLAVDWAIPSIFEYYEPGITVKEMSAEKQIDLFGANVNWNSLNLAEQLKIIDGVAYLMLY